MGILVNDKTEEDKALVNDIRAKLKENGGYCPCKIEKVKDNLCMCKEFLAQDSGECHCGLYIKN